MSILSGIIDNSSFIIHAVGHTEINEAYDWNAGVTLYPYYRLYYVLESRNVSLVLNEGELKLESGYLYFIPAFSVVSARYEYLDHFWVHFQPSSLVNNVLEYFCPVTRVRAAGKEEALFYAMYDNYRKSDIAARFAASGAFKLLFSQFLRGIDAPNENIVRFEPVLEYIEKNLRRKITLQDLAKTLFLDKVYFSNLFRSTFGISPMQYVANKRIDLARKLLLSSKKKINEISYCCGFNNELYFSRLFKKKTKMSPSEYRILVQSMNLPRPGDPC